MIVAHLMFGLFFWKELVTKRFMQIQYTLWALLDIFLAIDDYCFATIPLGILIFAFVFQLFFN